MSPIDLIFVDNEGCLVPSKGQPFPLDQLGILGEWIRRHPNQLTICTGRSTPYIEAISQALGLVRSELPCICEGGAVLYWPRTDRREPMARAVDLACWSAHLAEMDFRVEPGKIACLSLYPEPPTTVSALFLAAEKHPNARHFTISASKDAVDITRAGIDKAFGVRSVCSRLDIHPSRVLCIGDSQNDIAMMRIAGTTACPSNAAPSVKEIADYISPFAATHGVIDILNHYESVIA